MAKATRFADLDVSHLGPDATEQDLMEFIDYAADLEAKHPDLTQEEIMDRLFGHDGDWVRHARELGVDVDAYRAAEPPLLPGQRWGLRGGGWPPLTIYRDKNGRYFAERTFGSAQIISQQVAREWIECDQEEQL